MVHDDGIRVRLGGETVIEFPFDTATRTDTSSQFDLGAGYYALDIVGWEQGGAFINQFRVQAGTTAPVLATDLWHSDRVPEPVTLSLLGLGLVAVALKARSRR